MRSRLLSITHWRCDAQDGFWGTNVSIPWTKYPGRSQAAEDLVNNMSNCRHAGQSPTTACCRRLTWRASSYGSPAC